MRLLVIDKDKDFHPIYKRKLFGLKCELDFVDNIEDVLIKLKDRFYDLILINHNTNGPEICNFLKELGCKSSIIIIAVGKKRELDKVKKLYNGGIEGILNKCLNKEEFSNFVENLLNVNILDDQELIQENVPSRR